MKLPAAFWGCVTGVALAMVGRALTPDTHHETPERVLIGGPQVRTLVPTCQLDGLEWQRFLMYDHTPLYAPTTPEGRALMEGLFTK